MASPFQIFNAWMFDNNINTEIPEELLDYKSPITHLYLLTIFSNIKNIVPYIDKYLNHKDVWVIPRNEFFLFFKRMVMDNRIKKYDTLFTKRNKDSELYQALEQKFPLMHNYELDYLCDVIDNREDKDDIYYSLGLIKEEKIKKTKKEQKNKKKDIIPLESISNNTTTLDEFIKNNFVFN